MAKQTEKRALLIAGPTASGKSALSIDIARKFQGVVINADALQVYSELRVLTARPSPDEESQARHRLYGHIGATTQYSVARWLEEARLEIEATWERGFYPVITGGTGLYLRALEKGLAPVPEIPEEGRAFWRGFTGDLHGELAKRDPAMAQRLLPTDRQRLIRALEVVDTTGRSLLEWQQEGHAHAPLADVAVERIFMDVPRDELYLRADTRFESMVRAGALDEVERLKDLDPALPVMKAIGVPELLAHVRGDMSLGDATEKAKTATRNYIKRQLTWWRGKMQDWRRGALHDA